jgi:hypothetical protein
MGLDLQVEPKADYLLITVSGTFDLQSAKNAAERSLALCESHRKSKALVDCRNVTGAVSTIERYHYAAFLAELHARYTVAYGEPLRVAYVGNEPLIDPGRFGENVATNRGAMLKATTDLAEGRAWLGVR